MSKNNILKEIVIRLRDPKFLIDSQTNKQIALNAFFKSKIEIYANEIDKLENENKKLKDFIYSIENTNTNNDKKETNKITPVNIQQNYAENPITLDMIDTKKNNSSSSSTAPLNLLNEDQLKYFTYVLIKNFEVRKIDYQTLKNVKINIKLI